MATLPLHVDGNKIKDSSGNIFYLRGVNRPQFSESPAGAWCPSGANVYDRTWVERVLARMEFYGFTVLRCFIEASFWVNNPTVQTDSGTLSFRQVLDDFLTRLSNHGMYMILTTSHISGTVRHYAYPPLVPETLFTQATFRSYVIQQVTVLGSHNNLIIEPWNEPDPGWVGENNPDVSRWQADWQAVINGIRSTEDSNGYVHHLFMAQEGSSLASWSDAWYVNFNQYLSYPLIDSAGNIVYSLHCYRLDDFGNPAGSMGTSTPVSDLPHTYATIKAILQQEHVDTFSATHPVFIGEIGAHAFYDIPNESAFLQNILQTFNEWGISYASWVWRDDGSTGFPVIVTGTEATTGGTLVSNGQILVNAIAAVSPPPPSGKTYVFGHWLINGETVTQNPLQLAISAAVNIQAVYTEKVVTGTLSVQTPPLSAVPVTVD